MLQALFHVIREGIFSLLDRLKWMTVSTTDKADEITMSLSRGDMEGLAFQLELGTPVNIRCEDGNRPLHLAARWNQLPAGRLLLAAGARVNAVNDEKETPLHTAVRHQHADMTSWLLENRADPDKKNEEGHTPLWWAALNGESRIARELIAHGAAWETRYEHGDTCLHLASGLGPRGRGPRAARPGCRRERNQ